MSHLADRGWICVAMNYRVSPLHTWPDHIIDVKRALAWVKENIAEYGGDPNWVAITGGSAGGHLSALAALTPNDPGISARIRRCRYPVVAAVPVYGRYDWYTTRDGRAGSIGYLEHARRQAGSRACATLRRGRTHPAATRRRATVFHAARPK